MTSRPEILAKRMIPTLFLLLALGGALLVTTPRTAGASPCKPDGQACRTNQSCCGTNGHNGLCVNSSPPGKRPAGACCTPTTCEAAGAQCGSIANGTCLTLAPLNCGTCSEDEICTAAHVCETTTTTTTTSSTTTTMGCTPNCFGKECGDDGCGGSCGTCPAPETCGSAGFPNHCAAPVICICTTPAGEICDDECAPPETDCPIAATQLCNTVCLNAIAAGFCPPGSTSTAPTCVNSCP